MLLRHSRAGAHLASPPTPPRQNITAPSSRRQSQRTVSAVCSGCGDVTSATVTTEAENAESKRKTEEEEEEEGEIKIGESEAVVTPWKRE